MGSDFFRRRSPLSPAGLEQLPPGEIATPAQLAEYHRRKRRLGWYGLLWFLGLVAAIWIGGSYVPDGIMRIVYLIAVAVAAAFLQILSDSHFRCPVCGTTFETRRQARLWDLSPERRAALFGKYNWCDSCGTRFEKFPGAVYPLETDEREKDDDDGGLGIF